MKIKQCAILLGAITLFTSAAWGQSADKTVDNLNTAISGETNAARRYYFYAEKADKDGYPQVAKLFRAAAQSEQIHKRNHIEVLNRLGAVPKPVKLEKIAVATTRENLQQPIKNERGESESMYPNFIKQAEQDNISSAVRSFAFADISEREHLRLFEQALATLGHNPTEDYYVNKTSGETMALAQNSKPTGLDAKDYEKIG
jgi:rubrerythrin